MKKNILSAFVIIAMINCALVSCSQYEEPYDLLLLEEQSKQKAILNKETNSFKVDVISVVSQTSTRAPGDDFSFSAEQIKMLRKSSLNMFRSHGFSEKDILDIVDNDDIRLIFVATAFTVLMEYPGTVSYSMPKTRSESDETCYSIESITECLSYSLKQAIVLSGCLTKAAALKCISKLIAKVFPYANGIVILGSFVECMGWTE